MDREPFWVVWNASLSYIILALDETKKFFLKVVHAALDV